MLTSNYLLSGKALQQANVQTRRLVGGALCLDFANSVDWDSDGSERPAHADVLNEPVDLAAWGARLGLASATALPLVPGRELAAARALRRAIYELFAAVSSDRAPGDDSMARLEADYAEAVAAAQLAASDNAWRFDWPQDDPRRIRFAVAIDALDLLRDEEQLARVRICPGNNCGWLFVDTTGRRRWCAMEVCGSRAKMRRLYERRHRTHDARKSKRTN
jgi:predicted RNA-binding Zn ribbon-like protein